jgi:hypothetical protein
MAWVGARLLTVVEWGSAMPWAGTPGRPRVAGGRGRRRRPYEHLE